MLFFIIFGVIILTGIALVAWSITFSGCLLFVSRDRFDGVDGAFTLGGFVVAAAATSAAIVVGGAL